VACVNGAFNQSGSVGTTAITIGNPWYVGRDASGAFIPAGSLIDDVRIYNRYLTTNEIYSVYLEGRQ
jgi:hypothetical protein